MGLVFSAYGAQENALTLERWDDPVYSLHVITRRQAGKPRSRDVSHIAGRERHVVASSESIPTLKNRESIHFGFLLRGFVEKESIHDT